MEKANNIVSRRVIEESMIGITNLITSISGYRAYNFSIDNIVDSATRREQLLDDYFFDLKSKGVVPTIEDLRNIEILKGLPDITNEVVTSLVDVMKNMLTLSKLDIIAKSNASSDALVYIVSSNIMPKVIEKLYDGLSQMVQNKGDNIPLFDFFYDSLFDIISNGPLNYEMYLANNKLDDNDINKENWNELVSNETYRVLENLITSPTATGLSLIMPKKFEETMQVFQECSREIDNLAQTDGTNMAWCEDITPEYLLTGNVVKYIEDNMCSVIEREYGEDAKLTFGRKIFMALEDFRKSNAAEISEVPVDKNKTIPMYNYNSVSLSIVIMHGLIMASSELFSETEDDNLAESTKYILDAIGFELHTQISEDLGEVGEYAPHKMLSVFRRKFTPLISRSIVNLLKDTELTKAYAEIETIINNNIIQEHHKQEAGNLAKALDEIDTKGE